MQENQNEPKEYDAVLGGQNPSPLGDVVLGGLEGEKSRLSSPIVEARIAALSKLLTYGDAGLDLVIQALQDQSRLVQKAAYLLLQKKANEKKVGKALKEYKPWNLFERLQKYPGYSGQHVTTFANRKVEDFNPQLGITDPGGTAYGLRVEGFEEEENITPQFETLLQNPKASQIEALVFGIWNGNVAITGDSSIVVNSLVAAKNQLKSLKAVFIGDIAYDESEISWIVQSDISPILTAYPNLEILQVRGGENLAFSPLRHDQLKALIVETGGLEPEVIDQICALELPALEHLELWLGSENYGGNSSVENLMPILEGQLFSNLIYLGLRNSEYSDVLASAVVNSPIIEFLKVLDISMGTLSDEGALTLLNSPAIGYLDILNVSENYLSDEIIKRLQQLNIQVIADHQKDKDEEDDRYCSVSE